MLPTFFAALLFLFSAGAVAEERTASPEIWSDTLRLSPPLEESSSEIFLPLLSPSSDSLIAESDEERLTLHGVKFLEVGVGEGVAVRQGLELELKGKIGERGWVDGGLRDQDFPLEGNGHGASLRELDWMWLRLGVDRSWVHFGDQAIGVGEQGELRHFERNQQGIGYALVRDHFQSEGSWGGARSQQRVVELQMINGVSEGYDLEIGGGQLKILPGSVRVWVNGRQLDALEFRVDEMSGVLDLTSSRLPSALDRVVVEFQQVEEESAGDWGHFLSSLKSGVWGIEGGLSWKRVAQNDSAGIAEENFLPSPEALLHLRSTGALGRGGEWSLEWARSLDVLDAERALECKEGCGEGVQWKWKTPEQFPLRLSGSGRRLEGFQPWRALDEASTFEHRWAVPVDSLADHLLAEQKAEWVIGNWGIETGIDWLQPEDSAAAEVLLTRVGLNHSLLGAQQHSYVEWGGWQKPGEPMLERRRWESVASLVRRGFYPSATTRVDLWEKGGESIARHLFSDLSLSKSWSALHWSGGAEAELRQLPSGDEWRDSLRQISAHQALRIRHQAGELGLEASWQRTDEGGESGNVSSVEFYNRTSLIGGGSLALSARRSRSLAQPLVKSYRRVADGAGDVVFDSTVGRWIEGVDLGDYLFDGWVRDSSMGHQLRVVSGWSARIDQPLGPLFGLQRGLLNDLALWGEAAWDAADSLRSTWPLPSTSRLQKMVEGSWFRSGGARWTPALFSSRIEFSAESNHLRSSGVFSGDDALFAWRLMSAQQFNHRYSSRIDLSREEVSRDLTQWEGWRGELRLLRSWGVWSAQPLWGWIAANGEQQELPVRTLLIRPGVRGEWSTAVDRRLFAEYRWNRLWRGEILPPWEMSEGYAEGVTHRWEIGGEWHAADALQLTGSVIVQRTPSGVFRQKLRLEGRGVF